MKTGGNKTRFLVFLVTLVLVFWLGSLFHVDTQALQRYLANFPLFYSGLIFILLYVVVTFFVWFSKDFFRICAALLFGAYAGTLFVWIAETVNACVLFYFSRKMGRGFIEDSLGKRWQGWDEKLSRMSFFWLCMFRAAPLIPFRAMDLATGLTRISFKKYLAAVLIGSLPRIFWLQFILAEVGKNIYADFGALVNYLSGNTPVMIFSLVYVLTIILVALKVKFK